MKNNWFFYLLISFLPMSLYGQETNKLVVLSQDFLHELRHDNIPESIISDYAKIDLSDLIVSLNTKNKKLAFWINTYNAFVIYKLRTDMSQFDDKGAFYTTRNMNIGGRLMSFDDVEHGIIRNDRWKFSYGFFANPFNPGWINKYKNKEIDGRVHFALNCGAMSCPPVAIFDDVKLDSQLDYLSKKYLLEMSVVKDHRVITSPLFGWFRADFGDISGIKEYLVRYDVIPASKEYKVIFGDYDWTPLIDNFIDIEI